MYNQYTFAQQKKKKVKHVMLFTAVKGLNHNEVYADLYFSWIFFLYLTTFLYNGTYKMLYWKNS